jgi:hypothetical protein
LFERSYECICYLLLIVVFIDELDIDSIDEFEKGMAALHPKPEDEEPECYCGDICKVEVLGDYKTLWQRFRMCNNLAYDPEPCDMKVQNNRSCCEVSSHVLNVFSKMLNLSLIVLQPVPPLCDYMVWIDTKRGAEVKHYLHNMVELNMMEEEFHTRRMVERKCAAYFAMQREMAWEDYKDKREEERARKCEKARHAKEAYARGGGRALLKPKWPRLTQD